MTVQDDEPPIGELEHFGIPGMHWYHKKAQLPTSDIPRQITATTQVAHAIRNKVGVETSRVLLRKYGGTAVRLSAKGAVKGSQLLFSQRAAKGSGIVLKILGKSAKVGGKIALKGGKVYLKTALALAKYGLRVK